MFNKQLDEDRRIVISRSNVNELHKVCSFSLILFYISSQFYARVELDFGCGEHMKLRALVKNIIETFCLLCEFYCLSNCLVGS